MAPISESDLVLPTLMLLSRSREGLNTSQLIEQLQEALHPAGDELTLLAGRRDTKFSQKVRNLTSHDTLTTDGLASRMTGRNQPFIITDKGRALYDKNKDSLNALIGFSLDDTEDALKDITENREISVLDDSIVREGQLMTRSVEYRTRSRELRNTAVEYYSESGRIRCLACYFEFARAYQAIGEGVIQIHHIKPVSFMRGEPLSREDALANVRPLCANCHQMVHTKTPPIPICDLRSMVSVTYTYS